MFSLHNVTLVAELQCKSKEANFIKSSWLICAMFSWRLCWPFYRAVAFTGSLCIRQGDREQMSLGGEDIVIDIKRQMTLLREEQIEVLKHLSQEEGVHPGNTKQLYKVNQIHTMHHPTKISQAWSTCATFLLVCV